MRKAILLLTGMILLISNALLAQTNTFPSSGYVGIGTLSPVSSLDITGGKPLVLRYSITAPRGTMDAGDERIRMTGPTSDYIIAVQDGSGRVQHYWNATASGSTNKYLVSNEEAGKIIFHPAGNEVYSFLWAAEGTAENNISWSNYFNIQKNGNIGIGISSPSEKLVVNGKILTEEVKVQTVPSADFVFEPEYELLSISEVEEFIAENKHLPDVPSAKEFKENGIGLGEMDNILLQKIEELTLYIIHQEERIKQLECIVNSNNN